MSVTHIHLKAGQLAIKVNRSHWPIEQLLTFGSRINPRRSFLFVSKVLGKYVPCPPRRMRESYQALVNECIKDSSLPINDYGDIEQSNNFAVWGVAETATGLGAGFAQALKNHANTAVFYQHTTRHHLSHPLAFSISEAHSHAPSHRVYTSELLSHPQSQQLIRVAFLVDDEISTGKTLFQLTQALCEKLPKVEHIVWISLVNWLGNDAFNSIQQQLQASFPQVTLHAKQLLQGEFEFFPNKAYQPTLPEDTAQGFAQKQGGYDVPRLGYWMNNLSPEEIESQFIQLSGDFLRLEYLPSLGQKKGYCVIGTGEFTHLPFLLAEHWQERGADVLFQSTGRSPALEDGGLESRLSFWDDLEQGNCYLYNICNDRHAIILYESREQMEKCTLHQSLSATVGIYAGADAEQYQPPRTQQLENA